MCIFFPIYKIKYYCSVFNSKFKRSKVRNALYYQALSTTEVFMNNKKELLNRTQLAHEPRLEKVSGNSSD